MKIALVHDHLMQSGGAERVLSVFARLFPQAPIYTLLADPEKQPKGIDPSRIRTSFLQHLPLSKNSYQWFLPLMPAAIEQLDLSEFDVVLSSSSAFSKGVITKSSTMHISYCHTPARYLWSDSHYYIKELPHAALVKRAVPFFLTSLRQWDRMAADRVDYFVANSKTVQERIQKYYRRTSDIMYPPVDIADFSSTEGTKDYFLAGGRLVAYKRFDILVDAFNRLGMPLKIFGDGPEFRKIKAKAKKNIEMLGSVSERERVHLFEECIAFIHPQEEDFGITVLEASAAGRPVIALAAGGALETVVDGVTGVFFYDQDYAALIDAVVRFKPENFNPNTIRSHSLRFSTDRFSKEIMSYVTQKWSTWQEWQDMKRLREAKLF
ncbi:glycosyltransferase [Candidatus Uhrbacteria bacterium]|nr:glycosyltransferase [Candidatus Uhrbacteria bacterium]